MKTHVLALSFLILLAAPSAHSQVLLPQDRGFLGLLLGHTSTTDIDGRFAFGAEGGLAFTNGWVGSLNFLSSTAPNNGADVQILHYGLGVDYALSNLLNGLSLGLRLGSSSAEVLDIPAAEKESGFSGGVAIAYDRMLSESLSLGAQGQVLSNSWTPSTSSTYLFLSLKFWL